MSFVGRNFARWGTVDSTVVDAATRRYEDIVADLQSAVDPAEIDVLLQRAETILAEQAVIIPLLTHDAIGVAWWADSVVGIELDPLGRPLWNVEFWADPLQ